MRSPISNFFPDYSGGADYEAGSTYFQQRFVSLNQSHTKTMCVARSRVHADAAQLQSRAADAFPRSSDSHS